MIKFEIISWLDNTTCSVSVVMADTKAWMSSESPSNDCVSF